jgi:hypothetical protein
MAQDFYSRTLPMKAAIRLQMEVVLPFHEILKAPFDHSEWTVLLGVDWPNGSGEWEIDWLRPYWLPCQLSERHYD